MLSLTATVRTSFGEGWGVGGRWGGGRGLGGQWVGGQGVSSVCWLGDGVEAPAARSGKLHPSPLQALGSFTPPTWIPSLSLASTPTPSQPGKLHTHPLTHPPTDPPTHPPTHLELVPDLGLHPVHLQLLVDHHGAVHLNAQQPRRGAGGRGRGGAGATRRVGRAGAGAPGWGRGPRRAPLSQGKPAAGASPQPLPLS